MKAKKLGVFILTAAMAMSMLAGCGSDSSNATANVKEGEENKGDDKEQADAKDAAEAEKVSLKVWVPEEEMEITQTMCDAFDEAHPEFECTFEIAVTGIDESVNALETDAELAADVFQLPSGSISQCVDAGLLYPITADAETVNSLYGEGALEACKKEDLLYGIPFSPNSWFMYYNKNLYTEEEVKSLDTMMAKDLGDDVYNFSCSLSNSWYLEAFFYAAGCTLYGEDGTDPDDCTWNNENGVAAANYVIGLANNLKYLEDTDGVAGSYMKDGKLGALCSGTWAAPELLEVLGDDLGACPLPTITLDGKECQLSNFADYKCYGVKSNTAHPLAAQLLAEWFANEENQLLRYATSKATPTCLSLQDNAELAEDVATRALIAQTQYATPQPSISQINNYWTPVQALGEGIIHGDVTSANVQGYLDTVVNDVTSSLAE